MTTIVFRQGATGASGVKNDPLTAAELDANFANLNSYKVEQNELGAILPAATGATGYDGYVRYNPSSGQAEIYSNNAWNKFQGATGTQGASGIQGINGASGFVGSNGATGIQGASGATGAQGATGPGGTGSIGASGVSGATGPTGATGSAGTNGASGVQGASGSTGVQGASGSTGLTGATGPAGTNGATGIQGASGVNGASGYVGSDGASGVSGASGPTGATGPSGTSSVTDNTTTNASYYPMMSDVTSGSPTASYVSSSSLYFNPATGTLNSTIFNSLSDITKKDNIESLLNATDTVLKLDGKSFIWKDNGNKSYGVIAQELEQIVPELVDGEELKSVNYSGLIAFLINAVKELDARVKQLENK